MSGKHHVVVLGGGVIGLSVAWLLAREDLAVTVVDAALPGSSSWVAGGMLAPVTEAWPGEDEALALGTRALDRWPCFAAELGAASGRDPGLRTEGTLVVAADAADRADLDRLAAYLAELGREVQRLTARQVREREPALGPAVRGGLSVPGDLSVDNRALLVALRQACRLAGVRSMTGRVGVVRSDGVDLLPDLHTDGPGSSGGPIDADLTVVAAGAFSATVWPALRGILRPVKGEVLRLLPGELSVPPPRHTVRASVGGRPVYLVPRGDGELVLGATQAERGFDTAVRAGAVRELLADAEVVMPGISEYHLVECSSGLRPGTEDNLPLIGEVAPGVVLATGHHRNGMLLAPITADLVLGVIDGRPVDPVVDPARFGLVPEHRSSTVDREAGR
jgi:glycine oxidase